MKGCHHENVTQEEEGIVWEAYISSVVHVDEHLEFVANRLSNVF